MECVVAIIEVLALGAAVYAIVAAAEAVFPGCTSRLARRIGFAEEDRQWR